MMTTFDLVEVQNFVADLDARMSHGLDAVLQAHSSLCHEFTEKVREWGRSVFSGRIEFDPEVELVVRAEGARLASRAADLDKLGLAAGSIAENPEAMDTFRSAVERMNRLLNHWVRPQLAVGPGSRHWRHVTPEMVEEARRRVADLPSLPADWPFSEEQRRELGL